MKYIFLALFLLFSVLHLIASFFDNQKYRRMTMPFILILILLYYLFSAKKIDPLLFTALLTSWLGDVLLIPKGTKWFVSGGASFMIAHFCFIVLFVLRIDFSAVSAVPAVCAAAVYLALIAAVFKLLAPHIKEKLLCGAMIYYMVCNGAMNVFSFMLLLSKPCAASALASFGAVCFFVSDALLFYKDYYPKKLWRNFFPVLLTYIIAEFSITQSMLWLS